MIEAVQIPILLKAIDFVFDEGRKILEERRERRKAEEGAASIEKSADAAPKDRVPVKPEQIQETKQDLLSARIDEVLWQQHEEEVQHLVRLLETYSRNYHLAKEQYAKWGDALVPPIIVHNMTSAETSMIETIGRLESVLSKVYKKEISTNS